MDKNKLEFKKKQIRNLQSLRAFNLLYIIILMFFSLIYVSYLIIPMLIGLIFALYVENVMLNEIRGVKNE